MKPSTLVFIALLNSILGLSLLFPILGPLGRELQLTEVQTGCLSTAYSLLQFVASPMWGSKSEKVGRKPILLRGIFGYAVTFSLFSGLAQLGRSGALHGPWLFFGLVAARVAGGFYSSATLPVAQAYIADITARERRTQGMALVGSAFGLGIVLGPAISAVLVPFGLMLPLYASAAIAFLNGVFVVLFLPEPPRSSAATRSIGLAVVARELRALLFVGFAITVASVALEQTLAFYVQDELALSSTSTVRLVGKALAVCGLAAVLVQGGLVRRVRLPPLLLLRIGVPLGILALLALLVGHAEHWFLTAMMLHGLGQGFTMPGLTSALSLRASDGDQGAAAGLNSSSQALARALEPLLGTGLYELLPKLTYIVSAGILTAVAGLLFWGRERVIAGAGRAEPPSFDGAATPESPS